MRTMVSRPTLSLRSLVCIVGCLFVLLGAKGWATAYTLVTDNLGVGVSPWWHFVDSSSTGATWNVLTDSALGGAVMTNEIATTQAVRQFDLKTLAVGNSIHFITNVRTPSTVTTGTFSLSLLDTTTTIAGNSFGASSYPLSAVNGYTYAQAYNSATPSILRVANNVGTAVGSTSAGAVIGNGSVYSVSVTLTKQTGGILVQATLTGPSGATTVANFTDSSPATSQFNTLRVDGGGQPVYVNGIGVDTTIPSTTFTFTLPHAYITSATVFNSSLQPVRQLWKKYSLGAGSYTQTWDGNDDTGTAVPAGNYTIKVLYHNMSYVWDGVVGDTSSSFTGLNTTYQSYQAISYMSIDPAGDMYSSVGYNEQQTSVYTSNTATPNSPVIATTPDEAAPFTFVATDGINYYVTDCGCSYDTNNNTFVMARAVTPGQMGSVFTFSSGIDVQTSADQSKTNPHPIDYPSCIDDASEPNYLNASGAHAFDPNFQRQHMASGLAVETHGKYLAVSHAGLGTVEIFNKTSGALVQTLTISAAGTVVSGTFTSNANAPQGIAFAPPMGTETDGDLWVISGNEAIRYFTPNGTTPNYQVSNSIIKNLVSPMAVAVSPVSGVNLVAIAEGGTSQQVCFFTNECGPLGSIGQAGGYPALGPDVKTTKFWFEDMRNKVPLTFLAFQADGSLWVGDLGNCRALHFQGPTGFSTYLGQIATIPALYYMSVDPNNPTRVFTGHMEYQVDYTKPLVAGDPDTNFGGNGCWKLVKNWWGGDPNWQTYGEFYNITTLNNGRTYGITHHEASGQWYYNVFEFPSTAETPVRLTSSTAATMNGSNMEADGTIRSASPDATHAAGSSIYTQTITEQALTGFNASGDPQWAAAASVASMQCEESNTTLYTCGNAQYDPAVDSGRMALKVPKTASNYYVTYNPLGSQYTSSGVSFWTSPNNHLGVVAPGGTSFLWENSPGAVVDVPDGLGTFEDTSSNTYQSYGGHDGIAAFAIGHDIIEAYDGQYGYYSNQWMHYNDDGMFVGQFGVTVDDYWARPARIDTELFGPEAAPGLAGNISVAAMVSNAGTEYIYCTDEGYHAGIHRWHLSGSVNEIQATVNPASDATYALSTAVAWPSTNLVLNSGFDAEAATYTLSFGLGYTTTPVGWLVDNGTDGSGAGSFYTEWTEVGGYNATTVYAHSYPYRATIAKSTPYKVRPYQVLSSIPNGTYTLTAWVRSSGGQTAAQMYWKQTPLSSTYSGTTNIPTTSTWTQITIANVAVTAGQAEIGFNVQGGGGAGQYVDLDDVSLTQN